MRTVTLPSALRALALCPPSWASSLGKCRQMSLAVVAQPCSGHRGMLAHRAESVCPVLRDPSGGVRDGSKPMKHEDSDDRRSNRHGSSTQVCPSGCTRFADLVSVKKTHLRVTPRSRVMQGPHEGFACLKEGEIVCATCVR